MFFLQFFSDVLKILRSNQSPAQVAGGFVLGMLLGITPFWSLINVVVLLVIILINVNIGAATLAYALFSAVVYLTDPLLHQLGFRLLVNVPLLHPLWVTLYNTPVVPYTSFNNTVYLGSLVLWLVLVYPVYWATKRGLLAYRARYEQTVARWKWVKWIKASKAYEWYEKLKVFGS